MRIQLKSAELCLKENSPVSLRSARGLHIACTEGTLWITVTGQAQDIFLRPGETYQLDSNGLTLIESIGSGKAQLAKTTRLAVFRGLFKSSHQATQKSPVPFFRYG